METKIRNDLVVEKRYSTFRKSITANGLSCVARNPSGFFHNFGNLLKPVALVPDSRKHLVRTEWLVRTVLGDSISKGKVISIQVPQYRQYALVSDFLDLANLAIREEAALATMTGPAMSSLTKNRTADVQYAIHKCESLGSRKELILHGNPSAIAADFSSHMAVFRRHFFAEYAN